MSTQTSGVMINQDDTVDGDRENRNILCDAEQSDSEVSKVMQIVAYIDRRGDSIPKYPERGDDGVPSSGKCRTRNELADEGNAINDHRRSPHVAAMQIRAKGQKSTSAVHGRSPSRRSGRRSPQKLKQFADIVYKF